MADSATAITYSYEYSETGLRISQTENNVTTRYLLDTLNPTGYSQTVEETVGGNVVRSYTLGLDIVSQASIIAGAALARQLLYDAHGSTRVLFDNSGDVKQLFAYEAYGELLGLPGFISTVAAAETGHLFSGEWTDKLDRQRLLRRELDLKTAQFPTLDPFAGDYLVPQSLHKYAYVHGDPVNGIDPTGMSRFQDLVGMGQPQLLESSYNTSNIDDLINSIVLEKQIALDYLRTTTTAGIGLAAAAARYVGNMIGFMMDYVAFDDPLQLALGWVGASACFAAGTQVVVGVDSDGCPLTQAIEELQVNDWVLSRNQNNSDGELTPQRIVKVRQLVKEVACQVVLRSPNGEEGTIETTEEHPFYLEGIGWTPASYLRTGDRLLAMGGNVEVVSVTSQQAPGGHVVYNMEIEHDHTYFVVDADKQLALPVWVHNACRFQALEDTFRRIAKVVAIVDPTDLLTGTRALPSAREMVRQVGQAIDDAGHLVGKLLGGQGGLDNVIAQNRNINRGAYQVFEKSIARYIRQNNVSALIKVIPQYAGQLKRPNAIEYLVEFSNGVKWQVERFRN